MKKEMWLFNPTKARERGLLNLCEDFAAKRKIDLTKPLLESSQADKLFKHIAYLHWPDGAIVHSYDRKWLTLDKCVLDPHVSHIELDDFL